MASKQDSVELYRLCSSADPVEQAQGFQKLGKILFFSARRWLHSQEYDVLFIDDCVQKALIAISKNLSAENGPKSSKAFVAWAVTITRNKCIDAIRSSGRHPTNQLDDPDKPEVDSTTSIIFGTVPPTPEQAALRQELLDDLITLITRHPNLSEDAKSVLIGGYLWGASDKELANSLKTTDSNIKVIRSRSLARLRKDDGFMTALQQLT